MWTLVLDKFTWFHYCLEQVNLCKNMFEVFEWWWKYFHYNDSLQENILKGRIWIVLWMYSLYSEINSWAHIELNKLYRYSKYKYIKNLLNSSFVEFLTMWVILSLPAHLNKSSNRSWVWTRFSSHYSRSWDIDIRQQSGKRHALSRRFCFLLVSKVVILPCDSWRLILHVGGLAFWSQNKNNKICRALMLCFWCLI